MNFFSLFHATIKFTLHFKINGLIFNYMGVLKHSGDRKRMTHRSS